MMHITFFTLCVITGIGIIYGTETRNQPRLEFVKEPPYRIDFANTKGTKIECTPRGEPKPTVIWTLADGTPATSIEGLRDITTEGDLIFHSFKPEQYRLDVHSAIYRCVASNKLGKIHSRNVQVQGVVLQNHDIQVYDTYAIEQNTAVFKCHIPSVFKNYLKISAWIKNGDQVIEASNNSSPNDKYAVMPNGDLHIRDVSLDESGSKYKCKTIHSFTGQSQVSLSVGQLFVTESKGTVPPKILTDVSSVLVYNGDLAVLPCVAQGNPLPSVKWFKKTSQNQSSLLEVGDRFVQSKSVLIIHDTNVDDEGNYVCEATSESGKAITDIYVNVAVPLSVTIIPSFLLPKPDETVTLTCIINGQPITSTTWLHNGNVIKNSEANLLTISNINLASQGFYQCLAKNNEDMVQATAELQLSEIAPHFVQVFNETSIDSGSMINLICIAFGIPTPTVTWTIDDILLNSSSELLINMEVDKDGQVISNLKLEKTTAENGGLYACIAINEAGQSVHSARLNVHGKLGMRAVGKKIAVAGTNLYLNCPFYGFPVEEITWEKDDNILPFKMGETLFENGTLMVEEVTKFSEAGEYKCYVKNTIDEVEGKLDVVVLVPPKVIPFAFLDDQFYKGMRAHVTCAISQGDVPLSFKWLKDGLTIPSDLGVSTRNYDKQTSSLSIENVSSRHSGNYTCIVQNMAGKAVYTAQLLVRVPPRWVITPSDVSAMKDDRILLNCVADGFPTPEIVWKKLTDPKQPGLSKRIFNSDNIHLYQNGSLLIKRVKSHDEGVYYCQVSNGIGKGLNVRVQIKINAPPIFKTSLKEFHVKFGDEAQLQCLAQGDVPIKFAWYKNDKLIQDSQERYKIQTTNTVSDALSLLTIQQSNRGDNGKYQCVAENSFGVNKATIELSVLEPPDTPNNLKSVAIGSTTAELSWQTPYNGNKPIKKYIIQYMRARESWENNATTMETANGEPTNSIVSQLQPATNYFFRVFAENDEGVSLPSQILHVVTEESTPTGPPQDVQIEIVNTETFKVTWKPPEEKTWNGKILGYYIGYKEVDTEDPFLYKTLVQSGLNTNDLNVQISGLKQFTKYAVTVQSFNGQGKGPESEPVIMMTSEGAPSLPPTEIHCTTLTSQTVHVTWTAPPSDSINGILRGYKVVYKPASEWFDDTVQNFNVTLTTSMTLGLLEKFTNYSIYVLAMTKAGEGPKSTEVFCKTLDDVPGFPSDVKAIATSDDSVIVAWKQPEQSNGVLKSYTIYWKDTSDTKDVSSHTLSARFNHYEITRLKKDQQYDFWVSASTLVGEGQSSRTVSQIPSGPTVPAKVVSFEDKIITSWKSDIVLPCHIVGIPEPQRKWTFQGREIEENSQRKISPDGSLSIKEIKDEDAGEYECSTHNDFGKDQITYVVTVLGPPSSPIIEVATTTSNAIEIQWKPAVSKMSRIKGYTIHSRKDVGSWKEITVGDDVRSYRINGLDCGTRYEIYLTSFNKIGIGASSEVLVLSTNGSVPIAPSQSELIEESSNSISLYLSSWKHGGCPIQYFMVEYTPKSINEWIPVSSNVKPEQKRLVIPGLKPSTWYGLRMTAQNSAGSTIAKYDFATLTISGATIIPELQADAPHENIDGIMATLNIYIIVPIVCTVIILVAIFAMGCMCVKMRNRNTMPLEGDTINITNTGTLKRGDSSESFAYMKRQTLNRQSAGVHNDIDLTPYATFQLANHELMGTLRHMRNNHPMASPSHLHNYPNEDMLMMHHHIFPPCTSFIPAPEQDQQDRQDQIETTFVFPTPPPDSVMDTGVSFPNEYQNDAVKTT